MDVYVIRSEGGKWTSNFIEGGYVAGGWLDKHDLSEVAKRAEIDDLYRKADPDLSPNALGAYVGQLTLFLLDMKAGDWVITPDMDSQWLYYGQLAADPNYYYEPNDSNCWFPHRRKVDWAKDPVNRSDFSVPFQYTMRASKTAFRVHNSAEFLDRIGVTKQLPEPAVDSRQVVINQVLKLNAGEFEELVGTLLQAIGFTTEVTGKSGDGGIDVDAELNVPNLASMKLYVQVKRYKDAPVDAKAIEALRKAAEERDGQGAFITTSDFENKAKMAALEEPRIGLISGRDFVDMLVKHWHAIPEDFQEKLGLRPGLVPA